MPTTTPRPRNRAVSLDDYRGNRNRGPDFEVCPAGTMTALTELRMQVDEMNRIVGQWDRTVANRKDRNAKRGKK